MSKNFLFEIGVEEMPSKYMPGALKQMKEHGAALLTENRLSYDEIKVLGTPRRLAMIVYGLAEKQEIPEELVKGPSQKAAYDAEGNPTKALEGFLRGQKCELEQVELRELNGASYVYVKKRQEGKTAEEVLKAILPRIVTSFVFPKSMVWGNKSFRFARPIRWFVSVYGDKVVNFDMDGIPCGNVTKGHRVLGTKAINPLDNVINNALAVVAKKNYTTVPMDGIVVLTADEYVEKLRQGYVIVDQDERRASIRKQCEALAESIGCQAIIDEALLEEVTFIVEYPTALMGTFDKKYLKLPKEAVITPMRDHQRYFPVVDKDGNLVNRFLTVRNGDQKSLNIVTQGNERVLRARLADAQFFFGEDKKHNLEEYAEKCKTLVFQETLGTIYDKVVRIENNCAYLSGALALPEAQAQNLLRAAHLCKADLVTNMVKEFTELQGIMGREYALVQGETPAVATAIAEHYMPRNAGDDVAPSALGALLGIADRIDTLTGCFAIGIQPTGSQDPFGLRRQAIAIISTVLAHELHIRLSELTATALKPFVEKDLVRDIPGTIESVLEFFKGRFHNALIEQGYEYDVIQAVLNSGLEDITDAKNKVRVLSDWKKKNAFADIITSFTRVANLSKKAAHGAIDPALFGEESEKKLYDSYMLVKGDFEAALADRTYERALERVVLLKTPIDQFFDGTMVMVEDEAIRNNRLGLLRSIADMMLGFADLSAIVM